VGRLAGSGIAYGFEVAVAASNTVAAPLVTVQAGLALAPSGAALELAVPTDLSLVAPDPSRQAGPGGLFADCQPAAAGTYSAGSGVYLLAVGPASQPEGLAQVSGLGNAAAACNIARSIEAVRFRLIRLAIDPAVVADVPLLRNRIATACFDYDAVAGYLADPYGQTVASTPGLVDLLRMQMLSDDEVALALVGWSVDVGIQFVDLWSVRRRLTRPAPEGSWGTLVSERRAIEAEAAFLQFQDHIADLVTGATPIGEPTLVANFERLPPVGIVPVAWGAAPGIPAGFFAGTGARGPFTLEASAVEPLVRRALTYAPVAAADAGVLWLYVVRQNLVVDAPGGSYLVFTSGHVPYAAAARYGLAHFDYANYAIT
jgi:hypothetical protein